MTRTDDAKMAAQTTEKNANFVIIADADTHSLHDAHPASIFRLNLTDISKK
jgi:hypothetical protein